VLAAFVEDLDAEAWLAGRKLASAFSYSSPYCCGLPANPTNFLSLRQILMKHNANAAKQVGGCLSEGIAKRREGCQEGRHLPSFETYDPQKTP